jgi:hypothetical protein
MASFELSARVEPNETIELERACFPEGHRGVLDLKRQLVVGNRGMGKSFWSHALLNTKLRQRLAKVYDLPALAKTDVIIGFNGSDKLRAAAPTPDQIADALKEGHDPDLIWRAVLLRAVISSGASTQSIPKLGRVISDLAKSPELYAQTLTSADDALASQGKSLLIVFDALERLAQDWTRIRALTRNLLVRAVGLQSFRGIRAKIFMRVDQFADLELFRFPDSSKIKNDYVDLIWHPRELYGLLFFELLRHRQSHRAIEDLARESRTTQALPSDGRLNSLATKEQQVLIEALAGEFMGSHKKRGRVYTWVPLHLSDAKNTCSPRIFLTAWRTAAEHVPPPRGRAVDHLGLIEGVRKASTHRLRELREDYPWIDPALSTLRRQFVPIPRDELFVLWRSAKVPETILRDAKKEPRNAPVGFAQGDDLSTLLDAMKSIAVMEERANGKINVPDIFRVEAEILRKGGVAVPRRS